MGRVAPPGHDVEDVGLAPAEARGVGESDGGEEVHSEGCVGGELPLVLEARPGVEDFEGGDSHDEVIDKLDGKGEEVSGHVVVPLHGHHEVLEGGGDVVGVEDDEAELGLVDLGHVEDSHIPHVVGLVHHQRVYVELDRKPKTPVHEYAGHEQNDPVSAEGKAEPAEGPPRSLNTIVDVVLVVGQDGGLDRYVEDGPRSVVDGDVVEGVEVVGESGVDCQVCHRQHPQVGHRVYLHLHRKGTATQSHPPYLVVLKPQVVVA